MTIAAAKQACRDALIALFCSTDRQTAAQRNALVLVRVFGEASYFQRSSLTRSFASAINIHSLSLSLFITPQPHAPLSERSASTPSYRTGEGAPSNMGSASAAFACDFELAEDSLHALKASRSFHTVRVL